MQNNFDLNKTALFLRYLARATKTVEGKMLAQKRFQKEMALGSKIRSVKQKLDHFIQSQETKRLGKMSKKEVKQVLTQDFAYIKQLLINARNSHVNPDILYSLIERAEKIKKRIKEL